MGYVAAAIISYLLGSIPTAYLLVKFKTGKNVWEHGSRNVGALNVKRITGSFPLMLLTVIVDMGKAILALWIVERFFPAALIVAPFFVVLGHNFPIWTGFRGGRGIAVLLASALYVAPAFALIWLGIWLIAYLLSGYIAVGAMTAHILTPLAYRVLVGPVPTSLLLALVPVWMRYREKADLLAKGMLKKHFWGGQ